MKNDLKPLRILFILRDIRMGGVSKVLFQYMAALQKQEGIELTFISLYPIPEEWILDFLTTHHIEYIDGFVAPPGHKKTFFLIKWFRKIRGHYEKKALRNKIKKLTTAYDVLIDFAIPPCFSLIRHAQCPVFGWVHTNFPNFQENYVKKVELSAYKRLVCLTDAFKKDYTAAYPSHAEHIIRLYNPIDIDHAREAAQEDSPHKVEGPYFIAVQRLDKDKKVDAIITAFKRFYRTHPDYSLVIVGEGEMQPSLQRMAEGCPSIIFTGLVENPYPLIQGAQALILSSSIQLGEGLPVVLIEAQALGTLCISSDVQSGPAEILLEGKAGYLFEPESADSLYEVLEHTASEPGECADKIRVATEQLDRFRAENITATLIDEIRKVRSSHRD